MNVLLKFKNWCGRTYRMFWGVYHNHFDNPSVPKKDISFQVIGRSVEGRNILSYQLGEGNKNILFFAAMHGNEVGTVKLAYSILNWLYYHQKLFKTILKIHVVPCLNPDGYEVALKNPNYMGNGWIGRLNANQVDLNRNFPTDSFRQHCYWQRGKGYGEREEVFCGTHGASEPETKSLIDYVLQNNIRLIVSLHNAGSDIFVDSQDEFTTRLAELYAAYAKRSLQFDYSGIKIKKFAIRSDMVYPADMSEWAKLNNLHWLVVEGSSRCGSDWRKQGRSLEMVIRELVNKDF